MYGYYNYDTTPYLREIADNFSPLSPIREVAFMKPAQIGATTGVLEAVIAYFIGEVPTPQLYISADKELVEQGMKTKVERLIDGCGLRDKMAVQTNVRNTRRTGDTKTEKEYPGGFLHAIGAKNPGKLRQMSYPVILFDELDGMPDKLGNEGDPVSLAKNRSIAFESKRKILYLSTPLVLQTSKIYKLYKKGDQRFFYVPCIHCGEYIVLYWHLNSSQTDTGDEAGIILKTTDAGLLIPDSVGYKCQKCGKIMKNHHKSIFLKEGYWEPTAEPEYNTIRSYWLNSLYSPAGMFSWTGIVYEWLNAFDVIRGKVKDFEEYKKFRNTQQGLPFEDMGESPRYERVIAHRRSYAKNQIINEKIKEESGGPILLLMASCDVQGDKIVVDIKGYAAGPRVYTIDYRELEGSTKEFQSDCWRELEKIIENEKWESDDGKIYKITMTLIDAGYNTDTVYEFCKQYSHGVYPIFGREWLADGVPFMLATKKTIEKAGCLCYHINTNLLKDRIAASFRRDWSTGEIQPVWCPNFPEDLRDDYFRQFENEYKSEKFDKKTNKRLGFFWVKKFNTENEAFDTYVYNIAALEIEAEFICTLEEQKGGLGLGTAQWLDFWEFAGRGGYYVEKAPGGA